MEDDEVDDDEAGAGNEISERTEWKGACLKICNAVEEEASIRGVGLSKSKSKGEAFAFELIELAVEERGRLTGNAGALWVESSDEADADRESEEERTDAVVCCW